MQTSPLFKSSTRSAASPDGRFVAAISAAALTVRSIDSLRLIHSERLPIELQGPGSSISWSPSSTRLLVSTPDQIQVFSAVDSSFQATIRNPLAGSGKPTLVQFGASDAEILVCAASGLKLVIFDLSTSKAVEVNNPKFFHPASVTRGFSIRPGSGHLALLTRSAGKDVISIHHPATRQVERSWSPEAIDAQGLTWTPDGQWLLLWESPAHGRRLLLFTPDGQFFRCIGASNVKVVEDADLEPGIKTCHLSPDASMCAVGDYSRAVGILSTKTWRGCMELNHPATAIPKDTLQVWQEQPEVRPQGRATYGFLRATQMVSPVSKGATEGKPASAGSAAVTAAAAAAAAADARPGCSLLAFDASSTLLATRLDDAASTLWIWDVAVGELRAVLMFHSAVSFSWHPAARELLLITCQDDSHRSVSFVWDPLSEGPKAVSLETHLPKGKIVGKPKAVWVSGNAESPMILLSDGLHCLLVRCSDQDVHSTSWNEGFSSIQGDMTEDMSALVPEDTSALDDTFSFKHTAT